MEGLFRCSPSNEEMVNLRAAVESGNLEALLDPNTDVHAIASLGKTTGVYYVCF
jgi:hypothetical protein